MSFDPAILVPVILAIPGLVAFYWQFQDRRTAHFPPELGPVLARAVNVAGEVVEGRGRDEDVQQAIDEVCGELDHLTTRISLKKHLHDRVDVECVRHALHGASGWGALSAGSEKDHVKGAYLLQQSQERARLAIERAEALLDRLPPQRGRS